MPDFPESASFMPVPWKICHPSVVVLLSLLSLAGGLMVFTAVSKVSSIEADDDTGSQISLLFLQNKPCCTVLIPLRSTYQFYRQTNQDVKGYL